MSASFNSYGKFETYAVKGGLVGSCDKSTSGPRDAFGADGKINVSTGAAAKENRTGFDMQKPHGNSNVLTRSLRRAQCEIDWIMNHPRD